MSQKDKKDKSKSKAAFETNPDVQTSFKNAAPANAGKDIPLTAAMAAKLEIANMLSMAVADVKLLDWPSPEAQVALAKLSLQQRLDGYARLARRAGGFESDSACTFDKFDC